MQRTEGFSSLPMKALPSPRHGLHQAIQITNPQLDGWGDLDLGGYRRLWQLLPPAEQPRRQAA
jgi:hypothetical protein